MEEHTLRQHIIDTLTQVAPDVDANALDPDSNFRDQFELASVDFLAFVIDLEKRVGMLAVGIVRVATPELDQGARLDDDAFLQFMLERFKLV